MERATVRYRFVRDDERAERIIRLQMGRGMTPRAATITVDAAMYGIGCVEGEVRARIEKEKHDQG